MVMKNLNQAVLQKLTISGPQNKINICLLIQIIVEELNHLIHFNQQLDCNVDSKHVLQGCYTNELSRF